MLPHTHSFMLIPNTMLPRSLPPQNPPPYIIYSPKFLFPFILSTSHFSPLSPLHLHNLFQSLYKLPSQMTTLSTNDHPILRAQAMALMQNFLFNSKNNNPTEPDDGFDPDSDPYSSDLFRMYEFKVRKCTRSRNHDWTDCPFAHPGEKARRRDPRRFRYSATVCPEYRRLGSCTQADGCKFAHGVFECWLHPSRYRTEACKDGKYCKRKVCFFAHLPRELRLLPAHENGEETEHCGSKLDRNSHPQHCCRRCCALSPTSTLVGMSHFSPPMSPSLSPPQSPMKAVNLSGFAPLSRYSDRVPSSGPGYDSLGLNSKGVSYEDMVIAELLGCLEGIKMGSPNKTSGGLWVDNAGAIGDDQKQLSFSPSTPINPSTLSLFNGVTTLDDNRNGNGLSGPDLGWVNDLLM